MNSNTCVLCEVTVVLSLLSVAIKALLAPFGIMQFYSDGWGAYERHVAPGFHTVGKRNTQQIERKHLTLRTRIKRTPWAERSAVARKTICFSKSIVMHDGVIGLFMHRLWTIHLDLNNTSRTLPTFVWIPFPLVNLRM